jgi:aminocarboxymuconate-semialdehyde decarboxylase
MIIDVHAHLWNDEYLDRITSLGRTDTAAQRGRGAGDSDVELSARFSLMDSAGIDVQVLSASPQLPYSENREAAITTASWVNDWYAEVVSSHPARLRAFACAPMPHIDASLAEIDRALGRLGMSGLTMTTSVLGRPLTDPEFDPIFDELNRRGAVLYLHPVGNSVCSLLVGDQLTWMVGAPLEDTIAAAQLIVAGVPSRYPDLKIIVSHLGGGLPMLLQRMDNMAGSAAPGMIELPSVAARRLWYDTVGHGYPPALRCAMDAFGAERLVLGTDFPYEKGDIFRRAIDYVRDIAVDAHTIDRVLGLTADSLLRTRRSWDTS